MSGTACPKNAWREGTWKGEETWKGRELKRLKWTEIRTDVNTSFFQLNAGQRRSELASHQVDERFETGCVDNHQAGNFQNQILERRDHLGRFSNSLDGNVGGTNLLRDTASFAARTFVPRNLPVSTWPKTQTTGARNLDRLRFFSAPSHRSCIQVDNSSLEE